MDVARQALPPGKIYGGCVSQEALFLENHQQRFVQPRTNKKLSAFVPQLVVTCKGYRNNHKHVRLQKHLLYKCLMCFEFD